MIIINSPVTLFAVFKVSRNLLKVCSPNRCINIINQKNQCYEKEKIPFINLIYYNFIL
jgi:hypothetical protein